MLRSLARRAPRGWKDFGLQQIRELQWSSVRHAAQEQGLDALSEHLATFVPDIRQQYTTHTLDDAFIAFKVRVLHAFQMSLVQDALTRLQVAPGEPLTIVDIGDSAGTHIQYLKHLRGNTRSLSVNLDPAAVDRIRAKGLEAVHARAEELSRYDISPDLFTCFETLEHLHAPVTFLQSLAAVPCQAFVITVPYVAQSRVGLEYIRQRRLDRVHAEGVHVYELSPSDWKLLIEFSGWRVLHDRVYLQYPTTHPLRLTKPIWKHLDYEGFFGAVLVPDSRWRDCYVD